MHPQLEILLELQELRAQRGELAAPGADPARNVEVEVFRVDVEDALRELDAKIAELEDRLDPAVRERYRRLMGARGRALVPVIRGICYGCFMAVPAEMALSRGANEALLWCQNCGRFLYFVA